MKTLIFTISMLLASTSFATSFMAKYDKDAQILTVYYGNSSNTSKWIKKSYKVKNGKVERTNKTVDEYIKDLMDS